MPLSPAGFHLYNIHEMVSHIGKNKKMPMTLGINVPKGIIMISPEKSRDGPQKEWTAEKMTLYSQEGKHVFMELVKPSKSIDFHCGAKDTAQEIVAALGSLDIAMIEGPVGADLPPGTEATPWREDEIVAIAPSGHPLAAGSGGVTLEALCSSPLVLRETGSGVRQLVERACARAGRRTWRAWRAAGRPRLADLVTSSLLWTAMVIGGTALVFNAVIGVGSGALWVTTSAAALAVVARGRVTGS